MAQQPQNQRLWNMLVAQARTRFNTYPSLPASKWVHSEYVKKGGQFVTSAKDTDEGKRKHAHAAHRRAEERAHKRGR